MAAPLDIRLAVEGRLKDFLDRYGAAFAPAGKQAVTEATTALKTRVRAIVRAAFPGSRRVANAMRSLVISPDREKGSWGLVYSKFGRGKPNAPDFVDYLLPHIVGATLKSRRSGGWLLIPIAAGYRRIKSLKARGAIDGEKIAWVKAKGRIYLVQRQRKKSVLLAILVPQVKLKPRIALAGVVGAAQRAFPLRLAQVLDEKHAAALAAARG